jgi:hypothetical protein
MPVSKALNDWLCRWPRPSCAIYARVVRQDQQTGRGVIKGLNLRLSAPASGPGAQGVIA